MLVQFKLNCLRFCFLIIDLTNFDYFLFLSLIQRRINLAFDGDYHKVFLCIMHHYLISLVLENVDFNKTDSPQQPILFLTVTTKNE